MTDQMTVGQARIAAVRTSGVPDLLGMGDHVKRTKAPFDAPLVTTGERAVPLPGSSRATVGAAAVEHARELATKTDALQLLLDDGRGGLHAIGVRPGGEFARLVDGPVGREQGNYERFHNRLTGEYFQGGLEYGKLPISGVSGLPEGARALVGTDGVHEIRMAPTASREVLRMAARRGGSAVTGAVALATVAVPAYGWVRAVQHGGGYDPRAEQGRFLRLAGVSAATAGASALVGGALWSAGARGAARSPYGVAAQVAHSGRMTMVAGAALGFAMTGAALLPAWMLSAEIPG